LRIFPTPDNGGDSSRSSTESGHFVAGDQDLAMGDRARRHQWVSPIIVVPMIMLGQHLSVLLDGLAARTQGQRPAL
jgi:hypothetical protein